MDRNDAGAADMRRGRLVKRDYLGFARGSEMDRQVRIARDHDCICVPELREGKGAFRLFTEGDVLYEAMLAAIAGARKAIRLESYIFAADEMGRRFTDALAAAARAGRDVRLHLDFHGAYFQAFRGLKRELEGAGVRFQWFHPWRWRHPFRYLQRNHRKLLVVDEREAFLGGFNIRRENSHRLYGESRQRDTHARVGGELARQAAILFDRLWSHAACLHPDAIPEDGTEFDALLVPSASRRCRQRLACLHAGLIARSRRYVYLTTPYFGPGTVVEKALKKAARRGVEARLLVPRQSDPRFAGWTTRAAYSALLEAGVRIHEYLPRKLHAKTSVIDDEWGIVGSANLDYLSLFVNHELVLIARDAGLTGALRDQYRRDLEDAADILPSEWHRRGAGERCLEVIGQVVKRFL